MKLDVVTQKIKKEYKSNFDFAKTYYSIIFELNQIKVTPSEINLIAYSSVYGTLSTPPVRDEFMTQFNIPKGSFYNMIARLQKNKLLVKQSGKIRVNPAIQLDFTKPIYKIDLTIINNSHGE